MTNKSGLELIEELAEKVSLLNKRLEIIEQNTKEILNRANGFQSRAVATQPQQAVGLKPATNVGSKPATVTGSKVMGKIKNDENKAVSGVHITITNKHGHIVKKTKTNRAGDWMSFLPPGKYEAHYFLKDMIDAKVGFIVTQEQRLIRVAQPKGGG